MTVFKNFIKLAFKQKVNILVYLMIFLALTLTSIKAPQQNFEFKETKLRGRVINKDNSPLSKNLEKYIGEKIEPTTIINEENAKEIIYEGASEFLLVIPEGFEDDFKNKKKTLTVYSDNTSPSSMYLKMQLDKYLNYLDITKNQDGSYNFDKVNEALKIKTKVSYVDESNKNLVYNNIVYIFKFLSYPILAVIFSSIGMVVAEYSKNAIKARNTILPITSFRYNLEMFLAEIVVGLLITALFILSLLALGLLSKAPGFPIGKALILLASFSLTIVSFTLLFTSFSSNKFFLNIVANIFSLGTSFVSGVFVPLEYLSKSVLNLAKLFPTYYYIMGIDAIVYNEKYTHYVIYLLSFAVFFFTLSQIISKIKSGEIKFK